MNKTIKQPMQKIKTKLKEISQDKIKMIIQNKLKHIKEVCLR